MERLSDWEYERIAELLSEGAPFWKVNAEIHHSRWAVARAIKRLKQPSKPESTRSPLRLSLTEREEVSRGLVAGESLRSIARRLGRSPSTLSREVRRHGGVRHYRAVTADRRAMRSTKRPKPCKLAANDRLRAVVEAKPELEWSPHPTPAGRL